MQKEWRVAESISEDTTRQFPEIHPVILQLLWNRGLHTQEEIDVFLLPDWNRDTHSPWLFRQMTEAVKRVFRALENHEVITVHGDYDADGVCGTALLVSAIRQIAKCLSFDPSLVKFYLPHREKEGYGVSEKTVEYLRETEKTGLLITVDCGISNGHALNRGSGLGMDAIVCDHHAMPETLPERAILIHPLVPGETYPNKRLCGAGVAFKLACALIEEGRKRGADCPEGCEKWLLDLVAIATVTDVMPLAGENRTLESYGLLVLNKTRRIGLRHLLDIAGVKSGAADAFSIGFQIGPRLNAAGRMNHANVALNLLLEEDDGKARGLAEELHRTNTARQHASEIVYQEARCSVLSQKDDKLLIAVGNDWPAGLVGLVASKIANEFYKPTLVIGKADSVYVGSGRSVGDCDIMLILRSAESVLAKFGGHPRACGFSIHSEDNLEQAIRLMKSYAEKQISDALLASRLHVDAEVPLDLINWDLHGSLERFAPFGEGNPRPLFCARGLEVHGMDVVGSDGKHLRLTVRSARGKIWKMIGFRLGDWLSRLRIGQNIDIAYEVGVNEWNSRRELQFKIIDLRFSE